MTQSVTPSEAVGMSARRLQRIGPAMQAYVDRGIFAGISTLIARRGQIVQRSSSAGATGRRVRR